MSSFDARAREWDKDKMHIERSVAISAELEKMIPLNHSLKALEYGAGTGIISFLLKNHFSEITLMDNSQKTARFKKIEHKTCFEITRESGRKFHVFLLVAKK